MFLVACLPVGFLLNDGPMFLCLYGVCCRPVSVHHRTEEIDTGTGPAYHNTPLQRPESTALTYGVSTLSFHSLDRRGIILLEANPMSGVFRNIDPPDLCAGRTHSLHGWRGGGGPVVRKTPDTALYSIYEGTLWSGSTILGQTTYSSHRETMIPVQLCIVNMAMFVWELNDVVRRGEGGVLGWHCCFCVTVGVHGSLCTPS